MYDDITPDRNEWRKTINNNFGYENFLFNGTS